MSFDLATHPRPFVSATKLAEYLDCDRRTIVRMIHAGSFGADCVRVGRSYRIPTKKARAVFHVQQMRAS